MIHIANPSKPSGGGKRVARFTVGTSTAGWTAADCDYLCDGTADNVEINAAIQALPASGGEVVILDGTYNLTTSSDSTQTNCILMTRQNVRLSGNGNATILKVPSGNSITYVIRLSGKGSSVVDLQIDLTGLKTKGIWLYSQDNMMVSGVTIIGGNYGFYLQGIKYATLIGNSVLQSTTGIYFYGSVYGCNISGNCLLENSTAINFNCNYSSISENIIIDAIKYGITGKGTQCKIDGNIIYNCPIGISLANLDSSIVSSNEIFRASYAEGEYSLHFSGTLTKNNLVANNLIMGKNYVSEGGTGNTFTGNKYN